MATFAERLKFLRTDRDLTRLALSKLIGVSHSSINMYERGEREPNLETLEAIADYFNVDMDYLLGRQDIPRIVDLSNRLSVDTSSNLISLTSHEHDVITSYRNQPDTQPAVDRILGVEPELFSIAKVARGQKDLKLTKEQMKEFAESAKKAPNRSQDKDLF